MRRQRTREAIKLAVWSTVFVGAWFSWLAAGAASLYEGYYYLRYGKWAALRIASFLYDRPVATGWLGLDSIGNAVIFDHSLVLVLVIYVPLLLVLAGALLVWFLLSWAD